MTIIVRLLGLPEEDIAQLKVWSDHSVGLLNGINTAEDVMRHSAEVFNLVQYLSVRVELTRQNRTEGVILDLIDEAESGSDNINRNEIVAILLQLLTAGNETTTSLIGSAMLMLLKSPELQQELRNHPEKIEPFIEEALRTESPFFGHFRLVKKDTHIGGQPLPRGSRVMLVWASANRDESVFKSASAINIDRERPRSHIAFGYGIHQCIGAALARAEARIAFETMLGRTRHLQLSDGEEPHHVPSLFVRSLGRLHIEFK
jgi:cytochrome P450